MCNLYRLHSGNAAIAQMFGVGPGRLGNRADEVYPGYPGLVVAGGVVQTMTWGVPVVLKGRKGQPLKPKPVTNARDDKLHTPFWARHFAQRRCLIPVDQWAEPEGELRAMTRTWYNLRQPGPFAVAGIWSPTDVWGHAYAMVMVPANAQMAAVHDRMPVVLTPDQWSVWLGSDAAAAFALCTPWAGDLVVERSVERWSGNDASSPMLL